jgi:NitT/TauT family transport system ATP-binding protein
MRIGASLCPDGSATKSLCHRVFILMMQNQTVIEIESVDKQYGSSRNPVLALRDVNLDVRQGEFLSIIGPSGCGKSTLLRLIGDLLTPTNGRISINRHTPAQSRLSRECAIVFQSPTLMEWRNIERNIQLPLEVVGLPLPEREHRSAELLDLIRLEDFRTHYPRELSQGMQQQVAIARALAYRPSILLMDEPFGALDELTRERLGRELLEIWERTRVTIVFVTHSISEAVMLSDRVAVFTPRPGHVERVVNVNLPRPRTVEQRDSARFLELVRELRSALNGNGTR